MSEQGTTLTASHTVVLTHGGSLVIPCEATAVLARLGLPPDKVEASVRALIRTAQGVALAFRDLGFAHAADTLDAALAPFAHLGGES